MAAVHTLAQGWPNRIQGLLITALLLGWLVQTLLEGRLRERAMLAREEEFARMEEMLAGDVAGKVLFRGDGQAIWSNPRAEVVLRVKPGQLLTVNCLTNPLFQRNGWDELARTSLKTGALHYVEYQGEGTFGQAVDIRMRFSRLELAGRMKVLIQVLDLTDIHAMERALTDSEERFRQFLTHSPTVAWIKDEQGRYQYVSPSYEAHFGVQSALWLGKTDEEIWPAQMAAVFRQNDLKVLASAEPLTVEETTIEPSGRTTHWLNNKFTFSDSRGQRYIAGIGLDITQRQQDFLTAQYFASLVASSGDAIISKSLDGKITSWNHSAEVILGYRAEEMLGQSIYTLIPPGLEEEEASILSRIKAGVRVEVFETKRRAKDGRLLAVAVTVSPIMDSEGHIVAASKVLRDITQTKLLEQHLQASYEEAALFRTLVEDAAEPFFVVDMEDAGRMIYVNRAAAQHYGATAEEIYRWHVSDWDPQFTPAALPALFETIRAQRSMTLQSQHRTATGALRAVEISVNYFAGGAARHYAYGWFKDISQRVEHDQWLESAKAEAERASRAKSEFLSNMSHEIRTPLNGILGLLQLLSLSPLAVQQRRYVEQAYRTSQVLLALISDILDISRIEAGVVEIACEPFDLAQVLRSTVDAFAQAAADKGLRLDSTLASTCPSHWRGGETHLMQVLFNLVGNAIKFTEQGQISVQVTEIGPAHAEGSILRFEVRDSGIGIAQDMCQVIFQRFTQVESNHVRRFGGSGLGLAIAKGLIDKMGGEIGVTSVLGQGSCFWFELPLQYVGSRDAALIPPTATVPSSVLPARPLQGLRILLAEDQQINQVVLLEMLQRMGAEATLACNGQEAVQQVQAANERGAALFDAVLMDVQMPVMDGLEATRQLRTQGYGALPIIAITAGVNVKDREKCMAAGMNDFLAKPINMQQLGALILQYCRRPASPAILARLPAQAGIQENPPGFDVLAAIDRLGGDTEIYFRLLNTFLSSVPAVQMQLSLQMHDPSPAGCRAAARQLHALRSSLLTLGADEWANVTRQAEAALAQPENLDREAWVAALEAAYHTATTTLHQLRAQVI